MIVVRYGSLVEHNLQILTGFSMVGARLVRDTALPRYLIIADVSGKKIAYDTQDGWTAYLLDKRYQDSFELADCYFRRSVGDAGCAVPDYGEKMHPIAPNYLCYNREIRSIAYEGIGSVVRLIKQGNCSFESFEPEEYSGGNGKILFMTRLWDPSAPEVENDTVASQRARINETRIMLISALRKEYGNRTLCGLYSDSYANRIAPNLVLSRGKTIKSRYLKRMKYAAVCISSLGLHDSNGWKLAEYLAAGRAIVAERFVYMVPYVKDGTNYLSFGGIDECLEEVDRLLYNKSLRIEMQQANREFYRMHLRPDRVVIDSLETAGIDVSLLI